MARKFLDLEGLKHFISKIFGKTDISKIGDGTCTGAISALNQSMPILYHKDGSYNFKIGYSVGIVALSSSDPVYSVPLPTPPTGYGYDSYRTAITCVASSNGLAYTFFNISVSNNTCKFKVKCLSGDKYDGNLYIGVNSIMVNS